MAISTHVHRSRFRSRFISLLTAGALACGVGGLTMVAPASAAVAIALEAVTEAWVSPARGSVTEPFEPGAHRYAKVAGPCGTPVYAAAAGTVTSATEYGGVAGVSIGVDHGGGVSTTYGSLAYSSMLVAIGDQVTAGQQIAVTGMTGQTLTCGLRFSVSDLTKTPPSQDPVTFLADRGVTLGG